MRPLLGIGPSIILCAAGLVVAWSAGLPWGHVTGGAAGLLLTAALLPVAGLLVVFYLEDRAEPEPWPNLARYLLLGIASLGLVESYRAAIRGLFPQMGHAAPDGAALLGQLIVMAGVGEELAKYLCFRLAAWRDPEQDEPYDGCIYAAYLSLGFAGIENLRFVFSAGDLSGSLWTAALRSATAVPAHALFGAAWGLAFGLARFDARWRLAGWLVLPAVIILHGVFDWVAVSSTRLERDMVGYLALIAMLAVAGFLCVFGIHAAHRRSPHRASTLHEPPQRPSGNQTR